MAEASSGTPSCWRITLQLQSSVIGGRPHVTRGTLLAATARVPTGAYSSLSCQGQAGQEQELQSTHHLPLRGDFPLDDATDNRLGTTCEKWCCNYSLGQRDLPSADCPTSSLFSSFRDSSTSQFSQPSELPYLDCMFRSAANGPQPSCTSVDGHQCAGISNWP
ncbi:unnamed protein product [Menidia menidia]|uniref:(Atlantic silverside) hypothetical protein n=1 Tax=Menidia menidia TaxID=238744 RepID=A0A8S4BX72_9TELE|nr:unnamed protein product [Menidia menidia]